MRLAPTLLLGRWLHSREEDREGLRTYRRSDWPLPLSRSPRHILEFEQDGRVVSRIAGPADSRVIHEGHWSAEAGEPLHLQLDWHDATEAGQIEIVTLIQELLRVKIVHGSIE